MKRQHGGRLVWFVLAASALCFLLGVVLIPGAIESRELARTALYLLGTGVLLLLVAAILAIPGQHTGTGSAAAPVIWRLLTVLIWLFVVPQALFLGAFALVGILAGGLEEQDEAWDIVYPQAATSIILIITLFTLVPWKVPASASSTRRFGMGLPVLVPIAFWWWFLSP